MKKSIFALLIVALMALPMSALALEKIAGSDLGDVVGQAGVTIGFCGLSTTTISFSKLSWGDPGGFGTCGNSIGWLIIDGVVTISQAIPDGETLTLDIGRTSNTTCDVCGASGAVIVPANTTFIAVGLPTVNTTVTVSNTMYVGLGTAAGTLSKTLGVLNLAGLRVSTGQIGTLIIWAH